MSDDEMEDYGFEYSDEEQGEEDVDIENQYYNSKGMLENDDPREAIEGFNQVVEMEGDKGEWGFKALKQLVKVYYKIKKYDKMMDAYRKMLTYVDSAVTRNASEKKINSLLDFMAQAQDVEVLQDFYETTLRTLESAKNDRLWFKTQLKLAGLWFKKAEFGRMARILKDLHRSCQNPDGSDDGKKGSQLLEVYAMEIQMATEQRNNKRLKQLYQRALAVKSAIPHPRILGIIRECGGKMHMHDQSWQDAATDFFEAFKSYDEAGVGRRVACLKYVVLANMLMESKVDPFDAQEARPYKQDPEITAMTALVDAYQRSDINEFEKILKVHRKTILEDAFVRDYVEDLLRKIRTQVLLKLITPYTRVRIPFISAKLNVPEKDVEALLVTLILDGRVAGYIDQVNGLLEVGDRSEGSRKYSALDKWCGQLKAIHTAVLNRV
uniref:COP9 signalosome complex subunit 2 n=1 Tax=Chlamydomonas leiostraca TaxID=1034604 RepID=A0A7S0RGH7_9CHLO|eukprot:CAMPEP_0202867748 /NCGR_PEP_ID=MMETSP1391-20130828/9600_1 /ASSEMBLY_ACC=CAM_ASM_000867 /TAXON_ID=1034604 /ORGANISM="Chlamydomonas leiostraca, Strain SAG 11-49" /LENGTH=436 /DNA_ID=CAMNT_0049547811 /DNA_START=100 /DNA_END=1410 /DNA_ORIENTATION=+